MTVTTMYLGTEDVLGCKGAHTKVYSGEVLDLEEQEGSSRQSGVRSLVYRTWYWICFACLEAGSDTLPIGEAPIQDPERYWNLMKHRSPGCWVPAAYRT